jgi:4'-phosphopantetheinyl transferase
VSATPAAVATVPGRLTAADVHVWTIAVDPDAVARLRPYLAPEEEEQSARLHEPGDAGRHIVAHGALRLILASYVAADPRSLRFEAAAKGKPALVRGHAMADIRFSLAHSGAMVLCAVANSRAVGIDVEHIDDGFDFDPVAGLSFSLAELAALARLPARDRRAAFFAGWTRKEAYLKGLGEGPGYPLAGFDVSLAPGAAAALLASRIDADAPRRWFLCDLAVERGYAAALAVERCGSSVVVHRRDFHRDIRL